MKKKRILFLISDTGGGHRAAANAIAEAIEYRYPGRYAVIISDIWKNHMPWPFCKLPGTYGWLSGAGKTVWLALWKVTAHACLRRFFFEMIFPLVKNPMVRYLADLRPDLVVSLHPVMNHLGVKWVKAAVLGAPFVTVVTDMVSLHPFWICPEVDHLIVPTQAARQQALRYGMPAAKLAVYGQPISLKFARLTGSRRKCRRRLGLQTDLPAVLVVGGGEGTGHIYRIARRIAVSRLPAQLLVVSGRNRALKEQLEKVCWEIPTRVYGFVENMPQLMGAADVLVTKAGPGTISEAFAAGLPQVLCDYVPGQETGNVDYVQDQHAGIYAPQPEDIARILSDWLTPGNAAFQAMAGNAARLARPQAVLDIAADLVSRV